LVNDNNRADRRALLSQRAVLFLGVLLQMISAANGADLIVSANDGKYQRVEGVSTYPQGAPADSLSVIDASSFPPRVIASVTGIEHSIVGPPQAVAITPDGTLAFVGAPSRYDYQRRQESFGTFLQVVDLAAPKPFVRERIELSAHPNGLAVNPQGTLLLAACLDGAVRVLSITDKKVALVDSLPISTGRLSGVSFTHDGRAALVLLRDEGGAAVMQVTEDRVLRTEEKVSTGLAPYAVDVSSSGNWAIIGNAGLAGLAGGKAPGDSDSITLVDVSKRPFRAVQHLTVPSVPEGVALSPNGEWIVAQSLDRSNLTANDPGGRNPRGKVTLFAVNSGRAIQVSQLPSGEAGQGIVFAKDNRTILVQFNVERQIAVYQVKDSTLIDTGTRLSLDAGPASLRSMPR
jgi:DNA-binding beta-propeller fold protein YncE